MFEEIELPTHREVLSRYGGFDLGDNLADCEMRPKGDQQVDVLGMMVAASSPASRD
jgi:hypothetical protein